MDHSAAASDQLLFGPERLPALRRAVADLSWLLTRGYGETAARKLVGDRHGLDRRQRRAVSCSACADGTLQARLGRRVPADRLQGRPLAVDGFNVLILLETALSGGVLLRGRDGCLRDLAGVHGAYRRGARTAGASALLGRELAACGAGPVSWYLDRPVSSSGRLADELRALAREQGWAWRVELCADPDRELMAGAAVVLGSDARVLDGCAAWSDLVAGLVRAQIPGAWVVDLG
jgi:hypothetical protein